LIAKGEPDSIEKGKRLQNELPDFEKVAEQYANNDLKYFKEESE